MEEKQILRAELEIMRGINSLLGIGEVECDKCKKIIRHLDTYCCNTHECPICGATFDTIAERDGHFSQKHRGVASRGTRYCAECSFKAGYLKKVKNKKTGEVFMAMFVSRDEEIIIEESSSSS